MPESGPRSAEPTVMSAGRVLGVGLLAAVVAIALNAQQMLRDAQVQPHGWQRSVSMAVWEPVSSVSSAAGLHLPRLWTDKALGREPSDPNAVAQTSADGLPDDPDAADRMFIVDRVPPSRDASSAGQSGDDPDSAVQPDGTGAGADGDTPADVGPSDDPSAPGDQNEPGAAPGSQTTAGGDGGGGDGEGVPPTSSAPDDAPPVAASDYPTPQDPLQLWIIGDSMVQFFGDTMVAFAEQTGVIDARTTYQLASGLSRPDYFDWPALIAETLGAENPDVVVILVGGNDAQALAIDGKSEKPFSEAWTAEYSLRVRHVINLVTAHPDRQLLWAGQPIMRDAGYDGKMQGLNAIYESAAAQHDRVYYVDTRDLLRGPDGNYSRYVLDADGRRVEVRLSDGIHLNTEGGRWMSRHLLDALGDIVDLVSGAAPSAASGDAS